jgi:photosystem II stability/assembly factor-like uncharacterized protein
MGAPLTLLVGNLDGLLVLQSEDDGQSWSSPKQILPDAHVCALYVADEGTVFAGTRGQGLLRATGDLQDWQTVETPETAQKIRSLHGDNGIILVGTEPAAVFAFDPDAGTWEPLGDLWQSAGSAEWFYPVPTEQVHARYLAVDPSREGRLYAAVQVGGVAISPDHGSTWSDRRNLDLDVHMIEPHPTRPGLLYAGTGGDGLFRSTDFGESWSKISDPCGNFVVQFALTPKNPDRIFLGTGQGHPPLWTRAEGARGEVYRSDDGGDHWVRLAGGLPELQSRISALHIDTSSPQNVFVGAGLTFKDLNPPDNGVYHSNDGGESWRKLLDVREPEVIWSGRLTS